MSEQIKGSSQESSDATVFAPLPGRPESPQSAGWRCFHCDDFFTDERSAREHFGADETAMPACQIKAGAERGLLQALRQTEKELADAWHLIHNESTEAGRAYYAQQCRHRAQLMAAEEAGYERGLADGRAYPTENGAADGGAAVHSSLPPDDHQNEGSALSHAQEIMGDDR